MKQTTYRCKKNDAVIRVFADDNGTDELWFKIDGETSWIVIGYADLQRAISKSEKKNKLKDSHYFGGGYIGEALSNID